MNCKLGIYYSLTGILPDFANEIGWLSFFEKLNQNLGNKVDKDFYFLVFNKQDQKDIFINSLKGLSVLQPIGNNLPFQCMWDKNRKHKYKRSLEDAKKFILTYLGKSIRQRGEIYFNFKKYFSEYE